MITPSQRDVMSALLRTDFKFFFMKAFATLVPGQKYEHNWHVDAIIHHLMMLHRGETRRLIINLPPRYLKSTLATVAFPAFLHGLDPTLRFICASYSSDLAKKFTNDYRTVLASPWYREAFPGTRISPQKNTETEIELTNRGSRFSTSVEGTLTGRGGNVLVVDDLLKAADAMSDAKRNGANEWFRSTLYSRLDDKRTDKMLIVMQRVHSDDLTGFLERQEADEWTLLNLPAIAQKDEYVALGNGRHQFRRIGDPLFPARESLELLAGIKTALGSAAFSAQYLQTPIPPGGLMIKREWFRTYPALPPVERSPLIVQSWDTASKGGAENDFSVCTTWRYVGMQCYLLHVWRGRVNYPELRSKAQALAMQYTPTKVLIEDSGTGIALIEDLKNHVGGVIGVKPIGDKASRMSAASALFEAGQVHFPAKAAWLDDLKAELLAFPGGKHDDQVDSISQALNHMKSDSSHLWAQIGDGFQQLTERLNRSRLEEMYGYY